MSGEIPAHSNLKNFYSTMSLAKNFVDEKQKLYSLLVILTRNSIALN